jgi:hemolysin III
MTDTTFNTTRRGERMIDQVLHLAAIIAAVAGSVILLHSLAAAGRPELEFPIRLYILGLLSMLICSALYNAAEQSSWRPVLRRLDYAAIFLLIAGTYSPFLAGATNNRVVGAAYAGVWILAIAGMLAQLLFHSRIRKAASIVLYLALGWSVILISGPVSAILPPETLWLVALGGVLYTVGVLFHVAKRLPYQNAIWHGFVIAAASIHFAAVLTLVRS